MKLRLLYVIFGVLSYLSVFSQEDAKIRPFQFTFFPPLSTNGVQAPYIVNQFSLNAFVGISAGVDGCELGGFVNLNREYVKGAQFAGFANINAGYIDALQFSGFVNLNNEGGRAIQGSGFANQNGGDMEAISLSGFYNGSHNHLGVQASGFINTARDVTGVQAAGFVNVANELKGVQAAGFVNTANDVEGVQAAGFINLAKEVKGFQVAGFVNICDSIDGIPIALISIVRDNGYQRIEVFSDEVFYLNTSLKLGVEKFYTLLTAGMKQEGGDTYFSYGFGGGTNIVFDERKSFNIEYVFQQIVSDGYTNYAYEHSLNRIKANYNYQLSKHVGLFAGPSINFFSFNTRDYEVYKVLPSWKFTMWDVRYNRLDGWFGFNAGIRFL